MPEMQLLDRRHWLGTAAGALSLASLPGNRQLRGGDANRPRIAAVITEFTYRSHAHVILENFLEPYYFNGKLTQLGVDLVSLYVDQFPAGRDMARDVAKQYDIKIFPTIADTLRLGGNDLAVDGVLSIGEFGNYPRSDRGAIMYPRKQFFDEIVAVFRQSGRSVPLFNDKHLSYRWDWSAEMVQVARELKIPFMRRATRGLCRAGGWQAASNTRHPDQLRDGLQGTVLRIGNSSTRWCFACQLAGEPEPRATSFYVGPWQNRNLFKALSYAIQTHIRQRQAPYPVERTHLVTGMLAAAMDSRFEQHQLLPTPHLDVAYQPRDFRAMREMGASWKIITEDLPQPAGINPSGVK